MARQEKIKQLSDYFVRHFFAIMSLISGIGFVLIILGVVLNNSLVVSISTPVFSAATIGAIFKVLGYDVFLLTVLREIIYERKFLNRLRDAELRLIIRKTVETLRKRELADDVYSIFEGYLVDELAGVSRNDVVCKVELEHDPSFGCPLILGKMYIYYNAFNEASESRPLFFARGRNGVVASGIVTVPPELNASQIPNDPNRFWCLDTSQGTGFSIDGSQITLQPEIRFKDANDPSRGVEFIVKYDSTIAVGQRRSFSMKNKCIYSTRDYIFRKFSSFARDIEIFITKPENLEIQVTWFLTAQGKAVQATVGEPDIGPTSYYQKVEGILVPGNGFVLMWWPKRRT